MPGDQYSVSLKISEALFKLTTECVHLRSDETQRYETLATIVVDWLNETGANIDLSTGRVRDHLAAVPTDGDIPILLTIDRSRADELDNLTRTLSAEHAAELSLGDTISILLFHYMVDRKAARIIRRMGLGSPTNGTTSAT